MASEQSARAFALFDVLVELPQEERDARMQALRRDDPALCAEVERLLAADSRCENSDDARDRLAQWASHLLPDNAQAPPLESGQMLGPWLLLAPLGQGGMGTVWLGEREGDGFRQRVAIKRVGAGVDTPAARERFLRERGILAQLDHPNIAGLIDGGVSADGQPYFAMAYVEGQRIDRWCDGRQLDARARVTLFLQVLDAVQYAHRHMVIHRDLKPDNVLVDGDGRVHLLDFGIAKLLEEGVGLDATRELVMTPQYAAPEQLQGKPATAATDIYQLGLMLHALLVGGHPFGVTADMPMASLLRTLDDAPRSLRQAARTLVDDELARRGGNRKRLLRSVSGDLSAIVATCLAQAPEQRYPSADALAQDLRRWLDGQPVTVRSASRGYRLRWFARRYRWALAAVLGIIVALVVGLGLAVQQMREARMQAQRSEQLKNLVMSVFREQDPLERGSNARSPAQVVADGIRGLTPQQLSDPALRGDLLNDLGEIQGSL
ncbi:serine/threonine-protein kinase, partial [Thermomonas sp.]|uniref:serine/threonine-protein kinase n=1 Tax=Thermomonas sp. TaxID=1971895 RepID=UPI0026196AA4